MKRYRCIRYQIGKKRRKMEKRKTLRPSTERRPLRMHSLRPVPNTITSYSSSMIQKIDTMFSFVVGVGFRVKGYRRRRNKNGKTAAEAITLFNVLRAD
jgi:hypothetical protein